MAVKIIMGLQYGDEGKGRASHFEARNAKIVVRATGGANAGHTVVVNGKKYVMHILPSAIIRDDVLCVISHGVVFDLELGYKEIMAMRNEAGATITPENFLISERAHITLPHHRQLDRLYEFIKEDKVGTTMKGVGPTYEEKMRRTNIRMCDLFLDDQTLLHKIDENLKVYNILANNVNEVIEKDKLDEEKFPAYSADDELEFCLNFAEYLKPHITNTQQIIENAIDNDEDIIIEGAQSYYLDIDGPSYPMVTSSHPNASGTAEGAGIGPTLIDEVIGVAKAYTSRVGNGPFVTEQPAHIENDAVIPYEPKEAFVGDKIREAGHEYGSTTKRPRRCGWLDLVMLKTAVKPNGLTGLCINHMDTIGKLFDEIQVCTAYEYEGRIIDYVPVDFEKCKPIYTTLKGGWDTDGITEYDDLPENAKAYIEKIEDYTGVSVKYIGVGADDSRTIVIE